MNVLSHSSDVGDCLYIFIIMKNDVVDMFITEALASRCWI